MGPIVQDGYNVGKNLYWLDLWDKELQQWKIRGPNLDILRGVPVWVKLTTEKDLYLLSKAKGMTQDPQSMWSKWI